jgi:hypothetical protein
VKRKSAWLVLLLCGLAACTIPLPLVPSPSPTGGAGDLLFTPSFSPEPGPPASPTPLPLVEITVFFTDRIRYAQGIEPYEFPVTRTVELVKPLPALVLDQFFLGPNADEREQGLDLTASGFTGYRELRISSGVAHVFLQGECAALGATYTIAQPLIKNLTQFPDILYVKIYDGEGVTENPTGPGSSIPWCLEP